MPKSVFILPTGEEVTFFYVTGSSTHHARNYFNGKRIGFHGELTKILYEQRIPELQELLVKEIERSSLKFDALICAPSSGTDNEPYRDAVLKRWPIPDLSGCLTRKGEKKALRPETTVEHMIEEFEYEPDGIAEIGPRKVVRYLRKHHRHCNTPCFFAELDDGSILDFSFKTFIAAYPNATVA